MAMPLPVSIRVPTYTTDHLRRFPEDGQRYELLNGVRRLRSGSLPDPYLPRPTTMPGTVGAARHSSIPSDTRPPSRPLPGPGRPSPASWLHAGMR